MESASERFPESAEAHYLRAQAYLLIGERDLARPILQEALKLDPSHEMAQRALSSLPEENDR